MPDFEDFLSTYASKSFFPIGLPHVTWKSHASCDVPFQSTFRVAGNVWQMCLPRPKDSFLSPDGLSYDGEVRVAPVQGITGPYSNSTETFQTSFLDQGLRLTAWSQLQRYIPAFWTKVFIWLLGVTIECVLERADVQDRVELRTQVQPSGFLKFYNSKLSSSCVRSLTLIFDLRKNKGVWLHQKSIFRLSDSC